MYDYDPLLDLPDRDTRRWAMFCHLGGLATLSSIPFANIIVPLVIWLAKRDEHPFIDDQGKEAVNFQISVYIWLFVAIMVFALLTIVLIGLFLWPLLVLFPIAQIALSIIAGIQANDGKLYRYPFTIRFL